MWIGETTFPSIHRRRTRKRESSFACAALVTAGRRWIRGHTLELTRSAPFLQILKETTEEGLQFELKSKSLQALQDHLDGRPTQVALAQSRLNVQIQTEVEMEEIHEEVGPSGDAAV